MDAEEPCDGAQAQLARGPFRSLLIRVGRADAGGPARGRVLRGAAPGLLMQRPRADLGRVGGGAGVAATPGQCRAECGVFPGRKARVARRILLPAAISVAAMVVLFFTVH